MYKYHTGEEVKVGDNIVNDASGDCKGQKIVPRKSKPSLQGR